MSVFDQRPSTPSNDEIARELGITRGTPGSKVQIQRLRHKTRVWQEFQRRLAEWENSADVQEARRAMNEDADARRQEAQRARDAEVARQRSIVETWLAMPCRWNRAGKPARVAITLTVAHLLAARGKLEVWSSDRSHTRYVASSGDMILRVSDHELGYADYGTRKQFHKGTEVVVTIDEPIVILSDCARAVSDFAAIETEPHRRRAAAGLLLGVRRAIAYLP